MGSFIIAVLYMLVAVALLAGLYWLVIWVFAQLGLPLPEKVVRVVFVILVLLIAIWFVQALVLTGGPPRLRW